MKKLSLILGVCLLTFIASANKNDSRNLGYFQNDDMSLYVKDIDANNKKTKYDDEFKSSKSNVRDRIIEFAKTKLGATYVWGATGPGVFDCSGFVQFVFNKAADINLPRVSSDQATYKPRISSMNMNRGDLVFFETTGKGRISHVGIYMGDSQFIHASSGGKKVMISSLDGGYYNKTFRWAINPF